ncbi:MAG: sensor histidine kinase [Coriobacteriales bacterium]|nr:sensor histidine kinase [Coriobacteriales bacterium]
MWSAKHNAEQNVADSAEPTPIDATSVAENNLQQQDTSVRQTKRLTSIARSIWAGTWLRTLFLYLFLNIVLVVIFLVGFAIQSSASLTGEPISQGYRGDAIATLNEFVCGWIEPPPDVVPPPADTSAPELLHYDFLLQDGTTQSFDLSSTFMLIRPLALVLIVFEIISLISGLFGTRRIRRKLKPLNELALTAEALSSAAANQAAFAAAGMNKIEHLEQAIATASVDSPHITTGDKDLKSIEVALNGLLRQMQEAKLQQMHFVDDASHELRTPIAVIEGYVNMLDRWGKEDEAVLDESIEALKHESAHMRHLVEQLLFLARGDSGRTTLEREVFNMYDLIQEVRDESAMIDAEHQYALGKVFSESRSAAPLTVNGDVALIKQSMRVMVQNAAKYSPAGTTVTLDALKAPGKVGYLVQDEGSGVSPSEAAHVFERFWRADAARSSSQGGSGLGLSIAKWIIDAHEGTIEVLSLPNVGTRFTVWLPSYQ